MIRLDGRSAEQLRPLSIQPNIFPNAAGSALISLGDTKVLCAVSITAGVPSFLRGKNTGWLSAEYAMLPAATHERTSRESSACKRNGRSMEISRLIGRSFRTVVDLSKIPDKTLTIDCDVLQADGSTRVASIIGAQVALILAERTLLAQGAIVAPFIKDYIAAVSVGVRGEDHLVDLTYEEDSQIDVDFNFVMTRTGAIIEVQGSAEKNPLPWDRFCEMAVLARQSIDQIFVQLKPYLSA